MLRLSIDFLLTDRIISLSLQKMKIMKRETLETVVIDHPSQRFMDFLGRLKKNKLAQQERLSEMDECSFSVSI